MDREVFFSCIREAPLHGPISQAQVLGVGYVLDEWDARQGDNMPLSWLAYMLATDYHETAHTFQPIVEYGKGRGHPYGKPVNGHTYYGRGLVQLTWDYNYKKMGEILDLDLLGNPELALSPPIAVQIMFEGMRQGLFTGRKLRDYLSKDRADYIGARHIINGTDRASLIAGYAQAFEHAIKEAQAKGD